MSVDTQKAKAFLKGSAFSGIKSVMKGEPAYVIILFTIILISFPIPALALNCTMPIGGPDRIPNADLIVRAHVTAMRPAFYIPFITSNSDKETIVTLDLLDIYKGAENTPVTLDVRVKGLLQKWGPELKIGDTGEYLLDQKDSEWIYSGPGFCTFVSEKAWAELRKNKRIPKKVPAE